MNKQYKEARVRGEWGRAMFDIPSRCSARLEVSLPFFQQPRVHREMNNRKEKRIEMKGEKTQQQQNKKNTLKSLLMVGRSTDLSLSRYERVEELGEGSCRAW